MSDINTNPTDDPEFDVHDEAEVAEMEHFDFERALQLLSLVEKVANVAPKATSISGIALAEIDILNQRAKDIAAKRAQKFKEAEGRRFEAEQQRLKDEAEVDRQAAEEGRPNPRTRTVEPAVRRAIPSNPQPSPIPQGGEPSPTRRI